MPRYFDRYMAGECEAVWRELIALGDAVQEPAVRGDAGAVARETMRRATRNLRTIAARLEEIGYRFENSASPSAAFAGGMNLDFSAMQGQFNRMVPEARRKLGGPGVVQALQNMLGMLQRKPAPPARKPPPIEPPSPPARKPPPVEPPSPEAASHLKEIEGMLGGRLPLSLRAWYEHAGGVSFMGVHEALNPAAPAGRPTMLMAKPAFAFPGSADMLEQQRKQAAAMGLQLTTELPAGGDPPLRDPIVLMPIEALLSELEDCDEGEAAGPVALAPDDLHKAGISGDTWDMNLPCAHADAPFGRWPGLVAYLRETCLWGGFPGWQREPNPPREQIAFLTQDLLPF